ncbi:MAG: helix-turn-helix domain-containing protein [Oscillospiraceae bacterium]|nr:helix-turn-helix domain-containing protein [Oscillospiraceae bacterium]
MSDITYDKQIFAANLRRLMDRHGEKQVDVARLLGVTKASVSAYCSGEQMPRMDKLEQLARHYGVPRAALIESEAPAPAAPEPAALSPIEAIYGSLNDAGQSELLRYGRYLGAQEEFRARLAPIVTIRHYLVPAAAGYASPVEGEDYEDIPLPDDAPPGADFCLTVRGDSMAPYIRDGQLVYVRRDTPLREFDAGVFYVDGDVLCKQWCVDYAGTLHLLSANPAREDANRSFPRSSGQTVICFGKVLLPHPLPKPAYR